MRKLFEDFVVGQSWESASITLSEDDIIRFAREYDPQPMHTDPTTAAQGRFGGLIASGWQVTALSMKLFVESGAYGETPMVGMGIDELRWRKPVRPGDTLRVVREVAALETSERRPGYGIVKTRVSVKNQDDDTVMSMISLGQVPTRAAATVNSPA